MNLHISNIRVINVLIVLFIVLAASGFNSMGQNYKDAKELAHFDQFDFLTTSTGWVLSDTQLFWTSTSGQTWDEIGPSIPPEAIVQDIEFTDFNNGWMLWTTINTDGSSKFTIAYTIDHGKTWNTISPSFFESGEIAAHSDEAGMGWFDAQSGWVAVKQASSSNFSLGKLFTTSDGGNTWRRSTLPVADHVVFNTPQIGWAIGGSAGDQVFKTQDGGLTWQNVKLDLPTNSSVTAYPPYYADGQSILVMTGLNTKNGSNLYAFDTSSDNWLLVGQLDLDSQPGDIGLSIIDTHNFVTAIPGTNMIVRMRDGNLETLENLDGFSSTITDLDMISLDDGWAKSVDSKCTTASSLGGESASVSCDIHTRLIHTNDGGLTWAEIQLPITISDTASRSASELGHSIIINAIPNLGNTETFIGQGFDKCEIPTLSQLQTWAENSPYGAVNLYIGGSSRACSNNALTESYLAQVNQQGWKFIPTWVGPQAPCTGFASRMSSDVTTAYNQGIDEANLAVEKLAELGLTNPDKTGSVVYYDIEHYGTNQVCRDSVNAFMNGWVSQIHARGNLAGVYGSTLCDTGLSDFLTITNVPDVIWPARWYHNAGEGFYDPTASVWNLGTCLPNTVWADHQRIRQYEGDHDETWGGLTLGIDSNAMDGVVAIPSSVPILEPSRISFQEVASGLSNPVYITHANDNSGRMFVVERGGRIRIIKNGTLLATPFLDIQSIVKSTYGEQGLLGLAFHPSFESNGKFYVIYTAHRSGDSAGSVLTLRQYTVSAGNPDLANVSSGVNILTVDHPSQTNHNGGTITFGNDGYLYWSTGDGGGRGDPYNHGQNLESLLGKILRIDVNTGSPYSIPVSNPFYNDTNPDVKKEIWSYGLRNPWRISFDRNTHDLYIGDVGQGAREEIDFQSSGSAGGENYGWRVMEGSLCYNPTTGCNTSGKTLPVAEYDHSLGCSVTGGYVYRGSEFPSLNGFYFYGDYCSGRLFSIYNNLPTGWSTPVQLSDTPYNISSFGEDEQGELYLADYSTGKIYKIQYEEPFYTISGNAGASEVTLSYTDGILKTVTSQSDGSYSLVVSEGWSGTVTPTQSCFTFDPVNKNYNNVIWDYTEQDYVATYNPVSGCAYVSVMIGGAEIDTYALQPSKTRIMEYALDGGPVVINNIAGAKIIASLNQWRARVGITEWTGVTQSMGLPVENVSNIYVMPRYDYSNPTRLYNTILIANVDSVPRDITIEIGGTVMGTYSLGQSESQYIRYPGVAGGPVVVSSDTGAKIIASLYELRRDPNYAGWNGQSEMMGLPWEQLSDTYLIPQYFGAANPATLDARLFIANADTVERNITVKIGGVTKGTYLLQPNTGQVLKYLVDGGPVEISGPAGSKIIASLNQWRARVGITEWTGVTQSMALPVENVSNIYVMPRYDYSNPTRLYNTILIANVDSVPRDITIEIGGTVMGTYSLGQSESQYIRYPGVAGGPVVVSSDTGAKIIASLYELRRDPNYAGWNGQSEMMGLPWEQLSDTYLIPQYFGAANPATLDVRLFIAVP